MAKLSVPVPLSYPTLSCFSIWLAFVTSTERSKVFLSRILRIAWRHSSFLTAFQICWSKIALKIPSAVLAAVVVFREHMHKVPGSNPAVVLNFFFNFFFLSYHFNSAFFYMSNWWHFIFWGFQKIYAISVHFGHYWKIWRHRQFLTSLSSRHIYTTKKIDSARFLRTQQAIWPNYQFLYLCHIPVSCVYQYG